MPQRAGARRSKAETAPWSDLPADYVQGEGIVWIVVGGRGGAGITARRGQSLKSPELPARLAHGARVEQVELDGDRLRYRKLSGDGPDFGWVSLSYKGGRLLKRDDTPREATPPPPPQSTRQQPPDALLAAKRSRRPAHWKGELPAESADWTPLENALFVLSGGWYNPSEMGKRRREPANDRVSVVTPTSEARQGFHEQLWACFLAQDYPDIELIIIETYDNFTSQLFAKESKREGSNVLHISFRGDLTIGLKRNMGVHLASGKYIVQFDDDDLYAPRYVSRMVGHMQANHLAALTLGSWHNCELLSGKFGFVDPEVFRPYDIPRAEDGGPSSEEAAREAREARRRQIDPIVYGYGFSYAYLREAAYARPFPDVSMSEDYEFMRRLRFELGEERVGLVPDREGLCLHVLHLRNSSGSDSDREVLAEEVEGLEVCALDVIDPRLQLLLVGVKREQAPDVLAALKQVLAEPGVRYRLAEFHAKSHSLTGRATFLHDCVYSRVSTQVSVPSTGIWPSLLMEKLEACCSGDAELGAALKQQQAILDGAEGLPELRERP